MPKGLKNPQYRSDAKPKDDTTARQEQCSVIAIYYFMTYTAAQMKNGKLDELYKKFADIYPDINGKNGLMWKATFIEQAKLVSKRGKWVKRTSYQYGWWDAPPGAIASTKFGRAIGTQNTTTLMTRIWDKYFDKETKALFGGTNPKKDTWNTADMYMVQKGKGPEILKTVAKLKKTFVDECCADRGTYVGTLNTYLTQLIQLKILIPISLKKKTPAADLKITPTNIHIWNESGELDIVNAKFVKSPRGPGAYPWGFFNVVKDGSELTFGTPTGSSGNSFQYFANFKVGTYETEYLIEQRLTKSGSTKAEVKEIVLTNKGTKTRSAAQSGSVPMPSFRELIKEYTGEDYDADVPSIRTPLTPPEISTWKKYLKEVNSNKSIPFDLHGFKVLGQEYPIKGQNDTVTWLDKVAEIDSAYLNNPRAAAELYKVPNAGKFHAEFRLKLMQLRFLKALQKANGKLPELIVHMYYLAAKQNISEGDIHGPFLKVSS